VWPVKTHSPNPGEFWLETPISPIAVKLPSSPKMATLSSTREKIFPDRLIDFPVLLVIEIRIILHPPIGRCLTATDGSAIMICLKVSARRRIKMMKNL
jgi:hypothetical protein